MRPNRIGSAILLVGVALLIVRPWEDGEEELPPKAAAEVVRVVDGDTFEARLGGRTERVRLIGVDTPETVKPGAPVECFGPPASRFAHRVLAGRTVAIRLGEERRDRYGRLLAYVRVGGRLLNAELLRRGLARTLTIPPNDRLASRFQRLERSAARAGRGLWGAC